jgi:hypothetical protein
MRAVAACMLISRWAVAQPALTPDAFDDCKARRIALTATAMKVADINDRAHLLATMPVCRRLADGDTQVTEPEPPPAPDTSPFSPHLELAVRTGVAGTIVMAPTELAPKGVGPFVDLEVSYRWRREYSISVFGNYTHFSDGDIAVSNGAFVNASIITVTDDLYGFGARLTRHLGSFWIGGGVGAELEGETGYMGMHTTTALRSINACAGYRFGATRHLDGQLLAIVGEAGHAFDGDRELFSAQLAVGLKL